MITATQTMTIAGMPYIRVIAEAADPAEIEKLKQHFSYIHLYSYQPLALSGFSSQKQTISLIDLSSDEAAIFRRFKKNTRNEIRKTEGRPEMSFRVPDPDRTHAYDFYRQIKRRDGVSPDLRQEFADCLFFNAYLDQKLIVSMSCYQATPILRLKHLVSVRKQKNSNPRIAGYASRRLVWEICKYAKSHGYRWFDLAGVNLTDPKKSGVAQFKQSFGGELRTNYIYRYERSIFLLARKIIKFLGYNIH